MDQIYELLAITLGAILANNFIFSQFLGICPFLGVSKKVDTAVGMGIAVTFVMGLASAVCYAVNEFVLVRFGLEYMQTVTFILVIASLVQFVEMFLQKSMPSLYTALGIYLPLITTNCAVLGVVLLTTSSSPWSTASPAAWASCWPSCCSPASGSAWCSRIIPRRLRASPSPWSPLV